MVLVQDLGGATFEKMMMGEHLDEEPFEKAGEGFRRASLIILTLTI